MMRRALSLALCSLLLAGCVSRGTKSARPPGDTPAAAAPALVPSPVQIVGRVIAVDLPALTAIVDVYPYTNLPADFAGKIMISRTDDLRPTARLEASPYLRGRTLGARLLAGRPQVGDEVVIVPAGR